LSPNVDTGKEVYIGIVVNATQTRYDILRGQIGDIRPISGKQQVRITVLDYMSVLENTSCGDNASGMMLTITSAFQKVLHSVNFKPGQSIETDAQPVPIFDVSNKNAGSICTGLAEAALGYFFVDKYGTARFYGRNHASYTDHTIGQAEVLKNIIVSQPWDYIFNHISVKAKRPIKKQPSVIYFLPNPVYIASGGTKTFHLSYSPSSDVALGSIAANSKSTGDGTDRTSSLSASSINLGSSGGSLVLTAGANLWVTKLEIRGRIFDTVEEEFIYKTAASITARGLKQFMIDNEYLQDPAFAEVFSEALRDALILDRESIMIEIEDRPATQFALDIMNTVTFTAAALDIDGTYYITGYEHDWVSETGQVSKTTVWLHKLITNSTSITPSRVAEENVTPVGYESPPGDTDVPPLPEVLTDTWISAPFLVGWINNATFGTGGIITYGGQPNTHEGIALEYGYTLQTGTAMVAPSTGTLTLYIVCLVYDTGGGGLVTLRYDVQVLSPNAITYSDGYPGITSYLDTADDQNSIVYQQIGTTYSVVAGDWISCRIRANTTVSTANTYLLMLAGKYS